MAIPPDLRELSDLFGASGEELYIVGGAVRDTLLGKTPKDYDLATGASLDAVMDIVSRDPENKTDLTGKAFGVVRVWTPTGNEYEIATFRKDIGTGRRPDVELGATIEDDVQRRDLTVNALFYDMDTGEVVDYVGGLADIQDKRIRAVGDPVERFAEDKLRILRAVRFAARLGSDLDIETKSAILDDNELTEVSPDRIHDEVSKGVASAQDVARYFELLESLELYDQLFPGLMISPSTGSNSSSLPVQLALLLVGNDPASVRSVLRGMRYTNVETNTIDFLLKFVDIDQGTASDMKRGFGRLELDPGDLRDFGAAAGMNPRAIDAFLRFAAAPPSVAAKDLMARGLRGPAVGQAMEDAEGDAYQGMLGELRLYIRALLTEAAMGPADLPEDVIVTIRRDGVYTRVFYAVVSDPEKEAGSRSLANGAIIMIQASSLGKGDCGGAWMIGNSEAASGWGPLLYDVAMEYATREGGGLISDRGSVSTEARSVWDYYMKNRGDVTGIQMDDLKNTLTPEQEDNCEQGSASFNDWAIHVRDMETDWRESPLSKRWTKPPTTMNALKAAGKLVEL
jgi:hypothetical protein